MFRFSKAGVVTAVAVTAASLCLTGFAAPANADPFTPPQVTVTLRAQTITVPAAAPAAVVVRDAVTATSQADLDAQKAAQAAADQKAAAAAAAAAAARSTMVAGTGRDLATAQLPNVPAAGSGDVVAIAEQYVGIVPYSTGATPADGFECDGLVQWVFGQVGVRLPRGVTAQENSGVRVSRAQAVAGDLVVYEGEHIGIYDGHGGIVDSPDWGRKVSHRPVWGNPVFVRVPHP